MFGNPETTTGGMALRFYASVRLDIRRIEAIKAGGDVVGNRTRVTVKKNKVAPPFKVAEFDIMYNQGISKVGDILDIAVAQELVEKRGAFFSYNGTRLAQGRENAKSFMVEHPDLTLAMENQIRLKFELPLRDPATVDYGIIGPISGIPEEATVAQLDD
jgi:recombination protein RecA